MDEGLAQNRPGHSKNLRDKLMALPTGHSEPLAEEDMAMLSFMVSAAYQGIDLASRYPTFYGKLQTNRKLREHFLDALDLMEHSQKGTLIPLPGPPRQDLSFLHKTKSKPTVEQNSRQEWRITWRQSVAQIQHLLSGPEMAYRGEDDWYENSGIPLLRDQVKINGLDLEILLEATVDENIETSYSPQLTVVPLDDHLFLPALKATLNWGDYQEKVMVDARGRATFPPLPLTTFYDPAHNLITADLHFSLESIASPA